MTEAQTLKAKLEAAREAYKASTETRDSNLLLSEINTLETDYRRAVADEVRDVAASTDGEGREQAAIASEVRMSSYLQAALDGAPVAGREAEFNAYLGMGTRAFPLSLLAPRGETRATTDAETQKTPSGWLDRLFANSQAMSLGVSMQSVAPGISTHPVTASGPSATGRARGQALTSGTFSVSVVECTPKRLGIRLAFSDEDAARIPSLEMALQRDLQAALTEHLDRVVFTGETGGTGTSADVTGLDTASISELELSQANKVKADRWNAVLFSQIDGIHADMPSDLRIVLTTGANTLVNSTIHNSQASNETIGQHLMASGFSWRTRGGIETNTAADDIGGFIGLARGQAGSAVLCLWQSAELLLDPYTAAASGEKILNLTALYDFRVVRDSNFSRVKFTT